MPKTKTLVNADSIVVLNDEDTFMPTAGTVVIDYEAKMPKNVFNDLDNGDPRTLRAAIESGKVKGRILNVAALIAIYDITKDPTRGIASPELNAAIEAVEA